MGRLAAILKLASQWYVSLLLAAAAGILIGYLIFFHVFPGKPKIGIIDIPFTVITEDSGFVISAFLDYARQNDDVKAVVIKLDSPGGGAATSERLFLEIRRLREEKPVVVVTNSFLASGGYMMALGANHVYAVPASIVGSVGVLVQFFEGPPLIPRPPDREGGDLEILASGPHKLTGGGRRHLVRLLDQLKESFAQMVITQRGDRLLLPADQLVEGRIYYGIEAARLGMVDDIGGDSDAIEKAASLAGISNYDLVDVNVEVFRIFSQKLRRIIEPLLVADGGLIGGSDIGTLMGLSRDSVDSARSPDSMVSFGVLRRFLLPSGFGETGRDPLPGLPLGVNPPKIYYLYLGYSQ